MLSNWLHRPRHRSLRLHLWIAELHFKLFKSGHDFQIHHGTHYLRRGAEGSLARLGHRHMALIRLKTDRAGDPESDRGFLSGAQSAGSSVTAHLLHYDEDTPEAMVRTLQRVMRMSVPATGILMAHASGYATAVTWLSERGLRIPGDISLISREDDSFLQFLVPRPASYRYSPKNFALKIDSVVQQLIRQPDKAVSEIQIIPSYRSGNSVGPSSRQNRPEPALHQSSGHRS